MVVEEEGWLVVAAGRGGGGGGGGAILLLNPGMEGIEKGRGNNTLQVWRVEQVGGG